MISKSSSIESNSEGLKEFKHEFFDREGIHFNNAGRAPISRSAAEQISELGPKLPKYKSQVINNYLKLP